MNMQFHSREIVGGDASDADLQTRLRIALSRKVLICQCDVYFTVQQGVVILVGRVSASSERRLILDVTRHVAGVLRVEDELTVADSIGEIDAAESAERMTVRRSTLSKKPASKVGAATRSHVARRRFCASLAAIAFGMTLLVGCGRSDANRAPVHPVVGAIKFRGQAIPGAFVALHPATASAEAAPSPRATVAPDGSFALSTYDGSDGAPEGDYVLTVQWYKPVRKGTDTVGGPNVLPRKYASPRTSDVRITVAAGENRLQPIQLR